MSKHMSRSEQRAAHFTKPRKKRSNKPKRPYKRKEKYNAQTIGARAR